MNTKTVSRAQWSSFNEIYFIHACCNQEHRVFHKINTFSNILQVFVSPSINNNERLLLLLVTFGIVFTRLGRIATEDPAPSCFTLIVHAYIVSFAAAAFVKAFLLAPGATFVGPSGED